MGKKLVAFMLCVILICASASVCRAEDYQLKQVVVLSRHNIRLPLSEKGSLLGDITPHNWFEWTSKTAELSLRGAIEPTMPIGTKVVFERRENGKGESFFKVELIYQSVEQLRSIRPLSLDTPPMIVPISFAGVEVNEDGLIAEKDLMALLREKIDALDKIVDEYTEEEMADAA